MKKYIVSIDLGTTLIKFGIYDLGLAGVCIHSIGYSLNINFCFVEFNAEEYWNLCKKGIKGLLEKSKINPKDILCITLSSQAETLIVLDSGGRPLRNAISWLDSRSAKEVKLLKENFDVGEGYKITGQPDIVTTWPITKILWIKRNEKGIFKKAYKFLLLKDYIIYRFTGKFKSEFTIYNFSYYLNIIKKSYYKSMLDFAGIEESQLPELIEPGESAGVLTSKNIKEFGFSNDIQLNTGCLDQMAGMIGTGNIKPGIISETTGTVLVICTMTVKPLINKYKIPCHYNAIKDTYVLLPIAESGGISLEWFKNNFCSDMHYSEIDKEVDAIKAGPLNPIFLPYITGINAPEYNTGAKGVFYGINISHKRQHFAKAIMESIAFMLKKNLDYMKKLNISSEKIISAGGGAKSKVWCQMKADILEKEIVVTDSREAASLGAAILATVQLGYFKDINEAVSKIVKVKKSYIPTPSDYYRKQYNEFLDIYNKLFSI